LVIRKYFFFVLLLVSLSVSAQERESDYQKLIHQALGGKREVAVESGYVDILTETHAIEVEFANKWKQAIGQALWYGLQTEHKPGIVLVKEYASDQKYVIQLGAALEYAGLSERIRVWIWPDQFSATREIDTSKSSETRSVDETHWISTSSNRRHNASCRYFEHTRGRYCKPNEGKPCKLCGG